MVNLARSKLHLEAGRPGAGPLRPPPPLANQFCQKRRPAPEHRCRHRVCRSALFGPATTATARQRGRTPAQGEAGQLPKRTTCKLCSVNITLTARTIREHWSRTSMRSMLSSACWAACSPTRSASFLSPTSWRLMSASSSASLSSAGRRSRFLTNLRALATINRRRFPIRQHRSAGAPPHCWQPANSFEPRSRKLGGFPRRESPRPERQRIAHSEPSRSSGQPNSVSGRISTRRSTAGISSCPTAPTFESSSTTMRR